MNAREVFAWLFDVGVDILSSTLDQTTGTLLVQLGDVTKDRVDSDSAEWWQQPGFASRPALPQQGKASCQALILKSGDQDIAFAARDLRANSIYGNLAPSEACAYATTGQARTMWKADGSARQMTTDSNAAGGNLIFAGVSSYYQGSDGTKKLGGEWRMYGPWGGQWQDSTGYHLRTWQGVKIDAGGFAMPSPLSQNVATFSVSAGMVTLDAGVVALGHNDGSGEAATKVLSLQTQMVAFAGDLSTFTAAMNTFVAAIVTYAGVLEPTAGPAATTALTTACAAMEAAATAFSNASNAIMSALATSAGAKSVTVS